jgi:1,4-dihydroxy-6-naphthoate synthase
MEKQLIRVAHSPDSDDAFMFYALAEELIDTGSYRFTHTLEDIESLNRKALAGEYEVSAVSIHAYAYIAGKYVLLPSGASMGDRYGPLVVARNPLNQADIRGRRIAIPGKMTSAFLGLKLYQPDFREVVLPFDQIMEAVKQGDVDAGLIIHEGQLTYRDEGLHKVVDLGEWWNDVTGLPLPLGGNVVRRDLGPKVITEVSSLLRDSIQYSLDHRPDALAHAMKYARGLQASQADRFIGMYVNDRTLDYGEEGRKAVTSFLDRAFEKGLLPQKVTVEFAA